MSYKGKQKFNLGKFTLDVDPYVVPPENCFEPGSGVKYGADFQMQFSRLGHHTNKIGFAQLIFPSVDVGNHQPGLWNVDSWRVAEGYGMAPCLYSNDSATVGEIGSIYIGQHTRYMSANECRSIDTPREIQGGFEEGVFKKRAHVEFASYIVEVETGKVYNQGVVWGYTFVQSKGNLNQFDVKLEGPGYSMLSEHPTHQNAFIVFLGGIRDRAEFTKLIL